MSGLEVVAAVSGIVSAYTSAAKLYKAWRKDRKSRKHEPLNLDLEQQIIISGREVQSEYDSGFRRLGPAFARGDAIGQNALMRQLITLQQMVITLLTDDDAAYASLTHPHHGKISSESSSVKVKFLSALGQQCQRLLQATPIQASSTPCGSIAGSTARCSSGSLIESVWEVDRYFYKCNGCGWKIDNSSSRLDHSMPSSISFYKIGVDMKELFRRYHSPARVDYFECVRCGKELWDTSNLINHIRADVGSSCGCVS